MTLSQDKLETRAQVSGWVNDRAQCLEPYRSPGKARVHLGPSTGWYTQPGAEMETLSRPLWGLIPRAMGGDGFDLGTWVEALDHGTDPAHPEYWGDLVAHDQRFVEFASWGLALRVIPGLWQGLGPQARGRAAEFLRRINTTVIPDNNWLFFRVFANMALEAGGFGWDPMADKALDRIKTFHLEAGWYKDGPQGWRDYYTPMALHHYGLIYAGLRGGQDPSRAGHFKELAYQFAPSFLHWFDGEGRALPFGRSLTYRFAQGAFWGTLAWDGGGPFSAGVLRGLWMRHLRAWLAKPIFDRSGILTVGYGYDQAEMAEEYNAPGAPGWAFKASMPLALGEGHPFWKAPEEPMPAAPPVVAQAPTTFVILSTDGGRQRMAVNGGQEGIYFPRHGAEKYLKFAYSTVFGFAVPVTRTGYKGQGADNMLALSEDDEHFRVRTESKLLHFSEKVVVCRWHPWPGVQVTTALMPGEGGYGVAHRLSTDRELFAYVGGFTFPHHGAGEKAEGLSAWVTGEAGHSRITALEGFTEAQVEKLHPRCDLIHPLVSLPHLRQRLSSGTHDLAAFVEAGLDPSPLAPRLDGLGKDLRGALEEW